MEQLDNSYFSVDAAFEGKGQELIQGVIIRARRGGEGPHEIILMTSVAFFLVIIEGGDPPRVFPPRFDWPVTF